VDINATPFFKMALLGFFLKRAVTFYKDRSLDSGLRCLFFLSHFTPYFTTFTFFALLGY